MKTKQMTKMLEGVIRNFLESISDEEIKDIIKKQSYITGDCIPSMLMDEWVNDYDFYFDLKDEYIQKIKDYFENTHTRKKDDKYYVKLITDNAINLSDKIQLITKITGKPEDIVYNFDWQHIKSYFVYNRKEDKYELFLADDLYRLIVEKELIYTGSDFPLSSLIRLKKYIKKGWNVSATTILHIALEFVEAMDKNKGLQKVGKIDEIDIYKDENIDENDFYQKDIFYEIKVIEKEGFDYTRKFSIDDVIHHLNGVDPLTIQVELLKKTGESLTIKEIMKVMNG